MASVKPRKLKLYGFNNLTKTLSFNMYDISYAKSPAHQQAYLEYIDEVYSAERLTATLTEVADIIGAHILNVAAQDYEPQGASVTMLIAEGRPEPARDDVVMHLDKSHITVHTYPEMHPHHGICTFRADIDVSTCGEISPLNALNFLLGRFETDIAVIDYRVRGFTREMSGKKIYIDHRMNSIQHYIAASIKRDYNIVDVNVYQENIFHTKMMLREFDLNNYLFDVTEDDLSAADRSRIRRMLKQEMAEIFYGRNLPAVKDV